MRKVFEGYKLIETKDIEGKRIRPRNEVYRRAFLLARRRVHLEGIREPFEVIRRGNRYILSSNPITFNAVKSLNYRAVPCIIRNPRYELILNKTLRNLDMD